VLSRLGGHRPAGPRPSATDSGDLPGPRLPPTLQTVCYGIWPQRYLHWCTRNYGDRFTLRLAALGPRVVVTDAASIRDVFALKPHEFATNSTMLEPFLGSKSLLCQDGDVHARERRLLARAFRPAALESYGEEMDAITRRDIASWPVGRAFALHTRLQAITLEIILRVAFGIDAADRLDDLRNCLQPFLRQAGSLLVLNPSFRRELRGHSPWARFQRLRSDVLAVLTDEIRQRREAADLEVRTDVLSLLLRAESDGDHLDDEEVLHNLLTMVLAGHDTTATALAWTFDLLLHHPAAMDRLRDDLANGGRDYVGAIIRESTRLRPVVIDTGRTLVQPTSIGGVTYPAGTEVSPSILLAHHRADAYPDPMEFRPERFLDSNAPEPLTWIPFGGGVRRCLGAGFAMLEMEIVLRTILGHCELSAARTREDTQRRRAVTLFPRHGTRVVMTSRRQ
jgi:cytochrome P450